MIRRVISVLFLVFILVSSSVAFAKTFSGLYVFGDSLSDMGNAAAAVGDLPRPPYFDNRLSNGRVAVEALSHKLGLQIEESLYVLGIEHGTNYAVAGAAASDYGPGDLGAQIGAFLQLNSWSAPEDALYVVFIGGNDVREARGELNPFDPADLAAAHAVLNEAVFNIGAAVQALIGAGATHIVVVNSPNIGAIPETAIAAEYYGVPWLPEVTEGLTVYFNSTLAFAVNQISILSGIDIGQYDLFSTFSYLIANAYLLEITNTTDPCYFTYGNNFMPVLNPICVDAEYEPDPNSFFFIDEIHPTKKVHKAIGKSIADLVRVSE